MIRVAHVTTALSATGAGVHEAVAGLVQRLDPVHGFEPSVIGAVTDPENWQRDQRRWNGVHVAARPGRGMARYQAINKAASDIDARSIDIVHAHGLWDGAVMAGRQLARRAGCPFVVSPHGMLEPWAFRHNRLKKFLPWTLWERRALASADVLEAKSEMEARGFPLVGLRNQAAVIPVGLVLPGLESRDPARSWTRRCLFLSRLHYKKGADILLEAWALARPADWRLTIAGPDESGLVPSLQHLAARLGIAGDVEFVGPVHGDAKWSLLRSADLFVLPSRSENFGIVVPESMAVGVPCITTTGTPWSILKSEGIGWCTEPQPAALASALRDATTMTPDSLALMGDRCRDFVATRFSWDAVVRETACLYRWLLGAAEFPRCLGQRPASRAVPGFSCSVS